MQTCLEARGIEERDAEIVKNDYIQGDRTTEYSASHKDAISDGDVKGKGTNHGGHTHFLPSCEKSTHEMNYSNFDTTHGGDAYDINGRNGIGGRNFCLNAKMYTKENQYGKHLVETAQNVGQYRMK